MEFKLSTKEAGNGKQLTVFIHGWAISSAVWDESFKIWQSTSGKAIAFDLRGAGKSEKPATGYTLEAHANDIIHTIRSLGLENINLVGHSMGGAIAQLIATTSSSLIKNLILVNPVPASGVPLPPEALGFFRSAPGNAEVCKQIFTSSMKVKISDQIMSDMVKAAGGVSTPAILEGLEAWRGASFSDKLKQITCKTTLLSGDADPYLPVDFQKQAVVNAIPSASAVWIKGSGHYPHVEDPKAFVSELARIIG